MHRIFVVGCPRSGTTLAQTLVASHPELVTVPETHVFAEMAPQWWVGRPIGLASPRGRRRLDQLAVELGAESPSHRWPLSTKRSLTRKFVRLLDAHAADHQARGWVEKTPSHLRRIRLIEKYVPRARFCHVLRRGPDVVASMFAVTRRHPEGWGGSRSLEECAQRWLDDVEMSLSYHEESDHVCVRYRELTVEPEECIRKVWRALGLSPTGLESRSFNRARRNAVPDDAPWQEVGETVDRDRAGTFREVLTDRQQERVLERLRDQGRKRDLYWHGEPLFE